VERAILVFDDDCGFCRWSTARILAWDRRRRLRPVALGTREADDLLRDLSPERRNASWHLVRAGHVRSGGAAVAPLARLLPGARPIAALAMRFPVLTERLYRWVAAHRDGLGRLLGTRACAVRPASAVRGHDLER
jgi:predicted DCC family thiol-disulfide oxidoreductase YuxK